MVDGEVCACARRDRGGITEAQPRMVTVSADDLETAVLIAGLSVEFKPTEDGREPDKSWLDRLCAALDAEDE